MNSNSRALKLVLGVTWTILGGWAFWLFASFRTVQSTPLPEIGHSVVVPRRLANPIGQEAALIAKDSTTFFLLLSPTCRACIEGLEDYPGILAKAKEYGMATRMVVTESKGASDYLSRLPQDVPTYADRRGRIRRLLNVALVPSVVVVNAAGRVSFAAAPARAPPEDLRARPAHSNIPTSKD